MNKKELEALVEEQKETIDAKQARIKELDKQVQSIDAILMNVFQLSMSTKAQKRKYVRVYEKWLYSRQGQAISQLKIECNRLTYLNKLYEKREEITNELIDEITKQVESLKVQNEMD